MDKTATTRQEGTASRLSAPNITPLIDVLLVLLIIFMATLPVAQEGFDLSLPQKPAPDPGGGPVSHVVLQYSADRRVTINQSPVPIERVPERLRAIFERRRDRTLFIDGDPSLRYGEIVGVVDAAMGAGVERIGIITPGLKAGR